MSLAILISPSVRCLMKTGLPRHLRMMFLPSGICAVPYYQRGPHICRDTRTFEMSTSILDMARTSAAGDMDPMAMRTAPRTPAKVMAPAAPTTR
jgi:hypothetical protein